MNGFFPASVLKQFKEPTSTVAHCGACGLYKNCNTPKMQVGGTGASGVLLVGEFPDKEEDESGKHLKGISGQFLTEVLKSIGVNPRADCWKTNALICAPKNEWNSDEKRIGHCRPNILKTIKELNPKVIIPMGVAAVKALVPAMGWTRDVLGIARWVGWQIPSAKLGAWVCPTYDPFHVYKKDDQALSLHFTRHLESAFEIKKHPDPQPDYAAQIEVIKDHRKAAAVIRKMIQRGGVCAWDYETNRLKPDRKNRAIISCSICWRGKKTIAYPWYGEAIEATREFVRSPLPKIASNLKFEDRWTNEVLKTRVRNWAWDTMIGAHVADNRRDITSIKFQSFVRLGVEVYDDHIEEFLKTKGSASINKITEEIDLNDLLLYNGYDSLHEYNVALMQLNELGLTWEDLT